MSDRFQLCFDRLIGHEGGYVNDPDDPGGETKFGISKRSYPHVDIKNLTREDAAWIYRRDFWGGAKCDMLPAGVDYAVFDMAVNSGLRAAAKTLQKALNVPADGVIGPQTLGAAKQAGRLALIDRLMAGRALYFAEIGIRRTQSRKFLKGWMRRAMEVHRTALGEL
ncbi:MAG: glycoside hydrolase family 108 protein [Magnetococcales bacterium]|nr:glycoside hydrolase family 108 protein [Magnetococcales bacterium]